MRQIEDKAELEIFYALLEETAERDEFLIRATNTLPLYGMNWWYRVWHVLWPNMRVRQYELWLLSGDKAWYLYGASSNHPPAM